MTFRSNIIIRKYLSYDDIRPKGDSHKTELDGVIGKDSFNSYLIDESVLHAISMNILSQINNLRYILQTSNTRWSR